MSHQRLTHHCGQILDLHTVPEHGLYWFTRAGSTDEIADCPDCQRRLHDAMRVGELRDANDLQTATPPPAANDPGTRRGVEAEAQDQRTGGQGGMTQVKSNDGTWTSLEEAT